MATQTIRNATTFGAAAAGDTFFVQEGALDITGNLDYSGVNTSVIGEISRFYTGSIGSSSESWKTAFSTRLVWEGSGDLWFESNSLDSEATALIYCIGAGHLHLTGSAAPPVVTRLEALSGFQTVAAGVTVTTGRFGGSSSARLLDSGSAVAVTTLDVIGGQVYSQRPHTTINGAGGSIMLDCDSTGGVNAHGTINAYGAKISIRDSGTITTLNAMYSVPDASTLTRALTITNTTINMGLPGAQAFLDHPLITFTNTPTRVGSDGRQL
jgi:hypothetical protein